MEHCVFLIPFLYAQTASPNHRSIPSLFNESRSCSVGRQSYSGRLHGDHINVNNNEEYVRMSSHLVASNLSISTTALDRYEVHDDLYAYIHWLHSLILLQGVVLLVNGDNLL